MARNYQILCHTDDPQWKEIRYDSIGASECAVLFGAHPYTDWDTVVREKAKRASDFHGNRQTWWGQWCEKSNMQAFSTITGLRSRHSGLLLRSTKAPELTATLDGLVARRVSDAVMQEIPVKDPDQIRTFLQDLQSEASFSDLPPVGVLEMKQTSTFSRKYWNKPPERDGNLAMFWYQVQQQLFVSGLTWGVLCGRVGVADMVCHLVLADTDFHEELQQRAKDFWQEVEILRNE